MIATRGSKANGEGASAPPTDLELMLYADGELDEARHREVEAYVRRDPALRAKVTGLDAISGAVREGALSSHLADGIADAVMMRIARGEADAQPSAGATTGLVGSRDGGPRAQAQLGKTPANDNARGIFALAALAVAAAAALMVWGRTESDLPRPAPVAQAPAAMSAEPPASAPEPPAPSAEGEQEPGVEVAAIDFGARMGTIFYVPQGSATSGQTTTVVWLSDDGPGGN